MSDVDGRYRIAARGYFAYGTVYYVGGLYLLMNALVGSAAGLAQRRLGAYR